MRRHIHSVAAVFPLLIGTVLLTGCSAALVSVAVPTPPGYDAACARMLSQLPGFVLGGERRVTTPDSARTAAWGAVPVVLLCGVDQPRVPMTTTLLRVEGVDWFVEPLTNGTLFTTVKRVTPVSVSVPSSYSAAPEALPGISVAVAATIASTPAG